MKIDHKECFESVEAFLAATKRPSEMPKNGRESHSPARSWSGGVSLDQARELASNGWPEGLAKAVNMLDAIQASALSDLDRPEVTLDVTGLEFDTGLVLAGEPECWLDLQEQPARAAVQLVISCAASSCTDPETLIRRGVAIAALVDRLEAQRIRVGILVDETIGGYNDNSRLVHQVQVKRPEDPLELDRIVFAVGHPAFLRKLCFAYQETLPESLRKPYGIGGSYGYPRPPLVKADGMFGELYAYHDNFTHFHTDEGALAWVKREADRIFNKTGQPAQKG